MPNHTSLASLFTDIANAIRSKTGSSATIVADNFPTAISNIPTGTGASLTTKRVTANGNYTASNEGYDGYSSVQVSVPSGSNPSLITKSISINGSYAASTDSADGYSSVTVNVPNSYSSADNGKVVYNGSLSVQGNATYTTNGTRDTTFIKSVTVNVASGTTPCLGSKDISVNGAYRASNDGYDGYETVAVNVPNSYTSSDNGKVVQYQNNRYQLVSQTNISVTSNQVLNTTTYKQVTISVPSTGTDTSDATLMGNTQLYSSQMLNGVTAYARGDKYTGSITNITRYSYTPGTADIVISSGQFINNNIVIDGDTNLVASNIRSGVTIFGVLGTYTGGAGSWNVTYLSGYADSGSGVTPSVGMASTWVDYTATSITGDIGAWILFQNANGTVGNNANVISVVGDSSTNSPYSVNAFRMGSSQWGASGTARGIQDANFGITKNNNLIHIECTPPQTDGYKIDTGVSYGLIVVHGNGGSLEFHTATDAPASGVTQVSFSNLVGEPVVYACILDDGSSMTVDSTHRAANVVRYDDTNGVFGGNTPYSSTLAYYTNFTASYSNGTLTIASNNASGGGYFHNGATYKLYYLTAADLNP